MRALVAAADQATRSSLRQALRLCTAVTEITEAGGALPGHALPLSQFDLLLLDLRKLAPAARALLQQVLQDEAQGVAATAGTAECPRPGPHPAYPLPARIAVRSRGRVCFLSPSEVFSVRAEGNYVLLKSRSGTCMLRESLSSVAEMLRPFGLIRIHRSVLVNANQVLSMQPLLGGEFLLKLRDDSEFNVTRTYRKNLNALAAVWIGQDQALGTSESAAA